MMAAAAQEVRWGMARLAFTMLVAGMVLMPLLAGPLASAWTARPGNRAVTDDSEWAAGLRRTLALLLELLWLAAGLSILVLLNAGCGPYFHRPPAPEPSDLDVLAWYVWSGAGSGPVIMFVVGTWIALGARRVRWRVIGVIVTLVLSVAAFLLAMVLVRSCT
jgi:hypothetical protein